MALTVKTTIQALFLSCRKDLDKDLQLTLPPNSQLPPQARGLSRLGETPGFFSGSDLAALGFPTGIFQALSIGTPNSSIGLRLWQYDFFFNDTWRLRPGLTLNYGLRYEYNTVPHEVNNRIEKTFGLDLLPPVDNSLNLLDDSLNPVDNAKLQMAFNATLEELKKFLGGRKSIYDPDRNNFGPHFSFAWDPLAHSSTQAGKTVVRGGAGIYYDVALGSVVSQSRNVFPTFVPFNADVNFPADSDLFSLFLPFPNGFVGIINPRFVITRRFSAAT